MINDIKEKGESIFNLQSEYENLESIKRASEFKLTNSICELQKENKNLRVEIVLYKDLLDNKTKDFNTNNEEIGEELKLLKTEYFDLENKSNQILKEKKEFEIIIEKLNEEKISNLSLFIILILEIECLRNKSQEIE